MKFKKALHNNKSGRCALLDRICTTFLPKDARAQRGRLKPTERSERRPQAMSHASSRIPTFTIYDNLGRAGISGRHFFIIRIFELKFGM